MTLAQQTDTTEWSLLEPFIIRKVAEALKHTRRWRKDGPPLRLLNRHWRSEIDCAVDSIQPLDCRVITKKDLSSLRRFPNLKTLDVIPFSEALGAKNVAQALQQLPSVDRLTVNRKFLGDVSYESLAPLTQVTSVDIKSAGSGCRPHFQKADRHLSKLNALSLSSLSLECRAKELRFIKPVLSSLDCLTVSLYNASSPEDIAVLSSLDSLKLQLVNSKNVLRLQEGFRGIVSLDLIQAPQEGSLSFLASFPKLKHLSLSVSWDQIAELSQMQLGETGLESLELVNRSRHDGTTLLDCWPVPESLPESVKLDSFPIQFEFLMQMSNVKHLSINRCVLSRDMSWISTLYQLETLCLRSIYLESSMYGKGFRGERAPALKLRMLALDFDLLTAVSYYVGSFPKLEVLGVLHSYHPPRLAAIWLSNFLQDLCTSSNVREFGIFGTEAVRTLGRLKDLTFLSSLDTLWIDCWSRNAFTLRILNQIKRFVPEKRVYEKTNPCAQFLERHT